MHLTYIGSRAHEEGTGAIPLPEGWPADDHDEPDEGTANLKLASGFYSATDPLTTWADNGLIGATLTVDGEPATVSEPEPTTKARK